MGCCHSDGENRQTEDIQMADHKAIAFTVKGMQQLTFNDVKSDIDKYFESCGYFNQASVNIPLDWFSFQAEW